MDFLYKLLIALEVSFLKNDRKYFVWVMTSTAFIYGTINAVWSQETGMSIVPEFLRRNSVN